MKRCYLGLGSNLKNPVRQLHLGLRAIRKIPRTVIVRASARYCTAPLGGKAQPQYCNQVIAIQTKLPALTLLRHIQAIEVQQKRIRKKKWGSRTLDIDILLYGNDVIKHHQLQIPHAQIIHRDFVLLPLLELAPQQTLPDGRLLHQFLPSCPVHIREI